MASPLRDALARYASLSIIGMSKNAGKTTVLNRLITLLQGLPRVPAVTSIGRDGEAWDLVTGTEKPGIWVHAGTLVATAADALRFSDISREILYTTGMRTPLGEVVVVRALSDGCVQLAGPSMGEQLTALAPVLRSLGADIMLVDGAVSRKSLAAPAVAEAAVLCAGASYHPDMDKVVDDTAYAAALLMLPETKGGHPARRVAEGALTDSLARQWKPEPGDELTVRDGSRVLLTRPVWEWLAARGARVTVMEPATLCCVCLNPFSATGVDFDPAAFYERMTAAVPVPVVNVRDDADDLDGP